MAEAPVKERKMLTHAFAGGEQWRRLIDQLAITARALNRSEIMRRALVEKADRELPENWRDDLRFDETEAA